MSNWSSDGEYIILTQPWWDIYQGELYISNVRLFTLKLSTGIATADMDYDRTGFGDWYQLDTLHPVTTMNPLPKITLGLGTDLYWDAYDPGPSGIFQFKVQQRAESAVDWYNLESSYTVTSPPVSSYNVNCGKYYFRARAEDHAENWEAWPADPGEVWTTFAKGDLSGRILDNHGIPLPQASLNLNPAAVVTPERDGGDFIAYICPSSTSAQGIGATQAGYGSWVKHNNFNLDYLSDIGDYYLPPVTNLILNGELNSTFNNWAGGGNMPAWLDSLGSVWSGVHLGRIDTLTPEIDTIPITLERSSKASVDNDSIGKTSIILAGLESYPTPGTVRFIQRDSEGAWASPVELSTDPAVTSAGSPDLQTGSDDFVHVIWVESLTESGNYYNHVFYRLTSPDDTWSEKEDASGGFK